MSYMDNKAILKEIEQINLKIHSINKEISASCHQAAGKDTQERWLYGVVSVSFNVKGNSNLINLLKSNDYDIRRVKKAEFVQRYEGYEMWAIAQKYIKLEY